MEAASRLLRRTLGLPAPLDSEAATPQRGRPDVDQPMGSRCVTQGSAVSTSISLLLKRFLLNHRAEKTWCQRSRPKCVSDEGTSPAGETQLPPQEDSEAHSGPCRPRGPSSSTSEAVFSGLQGLGLPRLETSGWGLVWETGGEERDVPNTRSFSHSENSVVTAL